jgi:hypothetical protein
MMLLSVDWDFFSGCGEFVFDAPIWGLKDTEHDRHEAWRERVLKRGGQNFAALEHDFPLLEEWRWLKRFQGVPAYATVSHADAYALLERLQVSSVVNLDSHHDLYSGSGDGARVRPGNWAGLALEHDLIQSYTCVYPQWHAALRVAEGFDLERTKGEIGERFLSDQVQLKRVALESLEPPTPDAILLVQSPAWTNPTHDNAFFDLCRTLKATYLEPLIERSWLRSS